MRWMIIGLLLAMFSAISGCGHHRVEYRHVSHYVELGMSKQMVLQILEPTQEDFMLRDSKHPDFYIDHEGAKVEIHYFRTRVQENKKTAKEFTPYTFRNDKLVGIGWLFVNSLLPRPVITRIQG